MDGYWTTAQWTDTRPQRNGRIRDHNAMDGYGTTAQWTDTAIMFHSVSNRGADAGLWTDARDNLPNFQSSGLRWFDAVFVVTRDTGGHDSRGVT